MIPGVSFWWHSTQELEDVGIETCFVLSPTSACLRATSIHCTRIRDAKKVNAKTAIMTCLTLKVMILHILLLVGSDSFPNGQANKEQGRHDSDVHANVLVLRQPAQ